MESILKEFANGNIPFEPRMDKNSDVFVASKVASEFEEKLRGMLDDEAKKVFEEFLNAQIGVNFHHGIDRFVIGYRLGVLMTMEVFTGHFEEDKKQNGGGVK